MEAKIVPTIQARGARPRGWIVSVIWSNPILTLRTLTVSSPWTSPKKQARLGRL